MSMSRRDDKTKTQAPAKPAEGPCEASREHAGNKPRLTDDQAHAELRRRQRERRR
jgi:hypothetical protein